MMRDVFRTENKDLPSSHQAVSPQTALVLESDDIRMLTEIGFLAAGNGYFREACRIFEALKLVRPDRAFPLIGLAVTYLNAGKADQAVRLLESARLSDPSEHTECKTWLGFALQQSGHQHAGDQVLKSVIRNTEQGDNRPDPENLILARSLLSRHAATMARPSTAGKPAAPASAPKSTDQHHTARDGVSTFQPGERG